MLVTVDKQYVYAFDGYSLNFARRSLFRDGKRVELSPRVFDVLCILVENAGELVTKDEILSRVWADAAVEDGNVNRTISTLRQKLGKMADGGQFVETVPRYGYRFVAEVSVASTTSKIEETAAPRITEAHSMRAFAVAAVVLIICFTAAAAYFVLRDRDATVRTSSKNTLVRLTNGETDDMVPSFTNDGRIRFARIVDKVAYSYTMAADGSGAAREVSIAELKRGLWSPDGKMVMYHRDGSDTQLYLANSDGSGERQLPFKAGNSSWSRDSKSILFQQFLTTDKGTKNSDIFQFTIASNEVKPIVENAAFDGDPSLSPDGKTLLFVSERDGNIEVYKKDLATGTETRLTNSPGHDSYPSFSPDGTQIVFNSDRERENTDVYIMNADGSGLRKLTDLPTNEFVTSDPWSADGTSLLVVSNANGADNIYRYEIELFDIQTVVGTKIDAFAPTVSTDGSIVYCVGIDDSNSEIRRFDLGKNIDKLVAKVTTSSCTARLSPDGQTVVFSDFVNGNTDIFTVKTDGTDRRQLTNDASKDSMPSWSPDGKLIVFVANRGGDLQRTSLWIMNADGSGQREIYRGDGSSLEPFWSAATNEIFVANDEIGGRTGNFEILAISPDGLQKLRVTESPRFDVSPSVSPDGKRVAFVSNIDGNSEIYVSNTDGTNRLRITRDKAEDTSPTWSADGTEIYFSSNRGGKRTIHRARAF